MQRGGLENAIFPNGSVRGGGERTRGDTGRGEGKTESIGGKHNECGDHSGGNVTI